MLFKLTSPNIGFIDENLDCLKTDSDFYVLYSYRMSYYNINVVSPIIRFHFSTYSLAFDHLESISSTLYVRIFLTNFSTKPKPNQKKLPKRQLYKKFVRKMLMKLTTGEKTLNQRLNFGAVFSKTILDIFFSHRPQKMLMLSNLRKEIISQSYFYSPSHTQ